MDFPVVFITTMMSYKSNSKTLNQIPEVIIVNTSVCDSVGGRYVLSSGDNPLPVWDCDDRRVYALDGLLMMGDENKMAQKYGYVHAVTEDPLVYPHAVTLWKHVSSRGEWLDCPPRSISVTVE